MVLVFSFDFEELLYSLLKKFLSKSSLKRFSYFPADGVLVAVPKDEVPDDEDVAALPAEGVLVAVLTEEDNL